MNEQHPAEDFILQTLAADAALQALFGGPVRVYKSPPVGPVYPFIGLSLISAPDRRGRGRGVRVRYFARPLFFIRGIGRNTQLELVNRIASGIDEALEAAFGQIVTDGATFEVRGIYREQIRTLPDETTTGGTVYTQRGGLYRLLIHERA